jgi:hypothetical protein
VRKGDIGTKVDEELNSFILKKATEFEVERHQVLKQEGAWSGDPLVGWSVWETRAMRSKKKSTTIIAP